MKFSQKSKLELGDTSVCDQFILNNMITLEGIDIKVYIYILYLLKQNEEIDMPTLAKKICVKEQELEISLDRLQTEGLIIKNSQGFLVVDLKEQEINKSYIPKMETKVNRVQSETERKRIAAASAINETYFNGMMSLGWYTDIGTLFKNYCFSEEVMIALFNYCRERNALNKKYVYAVAESWYNNGVKTFEQLEEFLESYDAIQKIKQKISKSLRLNRNLTKYEEQYVANWIKEYEYNYDLIEEALKRTVSVANPSISYINGILTNWYKKGIKNVNDLKEDISKISTVQQKAYVKSNVATTKAKVSNQNYVQRVYDDLESFYDNM